MSSETLSLKEILVNVSEISDCFRKLGLKLGLENIYFRVLLDSSGIYASTFVEREIEFEREDRIEIEAARKLKEDLIEYFSGEEVYFDYPISEKLDFAPFQQKVLEETRKIPYGEVVTYKELAERIGTKGYRAVGQALKRNPLAVIIPCHRVVGKNSLGGYSGEKVYLKKALLKLEGAI
ncbi:MAG: methylated-DNA--[protein]-cysteine S-methyltransferase [Archaeoglobus sp.]|nr:methylated-DNA--[protein]-cysteine S-methyltransferase [Archaeoglobus sp.]